MYSSYRWLIFLFIYMSFTTQYIVYLSWNPFVPLAGNVFGFSMVQCSSIVAAVALGRLLFQLPGGMLVDSFSAKRLLVCSIFALGICISLGALGGGRFAVIAASQFAIGLTGVMVWPLCIKVIVEYFPNNEQDVICGLLNTGATIAVMVTNVYIPYAVSAWNWEMAFIGIGLLCAVNVLLVGLFMKEHPQHSSAVPETAAKPQRRGISCTAIRELLQNRGFVLCLIIYAGALYTSWGVNTWVTTYLLHDVGLAAATASKMMLVFGIAGCIALPLAGIFTRGSFRGRYYFLLGDLFFLATLLVTMPLVRTEGLLWLWSVLLGIGTFSHMGPLNLVIADFIDKRILGTAMALSLFIWQITAMAQSLLIGKALDMAGGGGSALLFGILATGAYAACLAGGRILFLLKRGELVRRP